MGGVSVWEWCVVGGERQAGGQAGSQGTSLLPLHTVVGLTAGWRRKLDVREISQRQIDSL